jgi:4-hydroxy-tetrahydrodipicolinate reductase
VSIIDINNQEDFNSEAFKSADVAIEFTNPTVAYDNYMKTFAAGVKLVSGSTGWMDRHGEEVKRLCTEGGKTLFWSSNFSLGVAIFSAVNKYLAKIMNNFPAYDVSMVETHHIHKVDAPSGTALALADSMNEALNEKYAYVYDRSRERKKREKYEIGISAVRGGNIVGEHEVIFAGQDEVIEFKHTAYSKAVFAKGAVQAAKFLAGKPAGFYDMSDVIQAQ